VGTFAEQQARLGYLWQRRVIRFERANVYQRAGAELARYDLFALDQSCDCAT
jgi:hypothetical protein